jgi:hypothetical protein
MGARHVRHRLNFPDIEDSQVRLPLMKPVQGIMVRTEVGGQGLAARRAVEHPAERHPVHDATMHAEPYNTPRPVVDHNEHPVRVEDGRFAPKQIHTPAGSLGLLLAWTANKDKMHAALRWAGITCQTSFSSEWYGVFSKSKRYVVLHLTGQRRLYGWPEEWPSTPGKGHFVMMQAEWVLKEGERIELTGVNRILIRAEDVEMVELIEMPATLQETQDGRSQGANTAAATVASGSAE